MTAQIIDRPDHAERRAHPAALFGMPVALWMFAGLFLGLTAFGAWQMALYEHDRLFALMLAQAVLYLAAVWWVLRNGAALDRKPALILVLGVALLARAMLLPMPPVSTDVYRYVWDGRVQSAGINPYRYMPANPALTGLRDEEVYSRINRVDTAVTIYPPMAQIVFLAASKLGDSVTAMKAMMVAFEALAVFALLRLLKAGGQSRAHILFYAWHPLPLFEFAGSGHVDAIAIGLMLAAMLAANAKRPFLSGMLLAAGAAAKYVPAVIGPALYRRWDWRMPAGFGLALVLLYLPYLGVGRGILGFLPGYVQEEGIAGSGIFWVALVQRLTSAQGNLTTAYFGLVALVLAGLGLAALFRRAPDRISPALTGALLLAFTLAVTPHYAWYFSWLVPLLCLRPSLAVLWLTLAAPALYGLPWLPDAFTVQVAIYLPALVLILLDVLRPQATFSAERAPS
ncbi:glycosyltransferase 87 family protein [Bosea sp. PAMC 26642]|uniref:glycosyltransferase 87 family protein n=1 Tax=Bosea sp. (strain PAMC 26642) TaxID=1792307 RepID=UPI00076FFC49|nr:glycosyltransferase 87 family protein [Bosea sp. PAMC 26642]AMJ59622.1 hypothetical protein AXW83_04265 [Bosea sp. PAMC 26642]